MCTYYWLLFQTNVYAGKFGANGLSEKHTLFILGANRQNELIFFGAIG